MLLNIWAELSVYSIPEIIAVLASLTYVVLASREHSGCWPAGMLGSTIYVVVFFQYKLYMDSALNIFYVVMAIYGWLMWKNRQSNTGFSNAAATSVSKTSIKQWQAIKHMNAIAVILLLSALSGFYLDNYTDAAYPYFDSLTTWSSFLATWMVVNKILETWLYWIVIDAASIYLYINKELYFTALLFGLYVIIATYGYFHWKKLYQNTTHETLASNN